MTSVYTKIASCLSRFADEHGLPNAISMTELAQLMNAPNEASCKMMLGRIMRQERIGLNNELAKCGLVVTAYGPTSDGSHMVATIKSFNGVE